MTTAECLTTAEEREGEALCEVCKSDSRIGMIPHTDKLVCPVCAHMAQDLMVEAFLAYQAGEAEWAGPVMELAKAMDKITRKENA